MNRGESRHAVARAVCHGQKGEIRKRYSDGQEDQLGALGLVTIDGFYDLRNQNHLLHHGKSQGVKLFDVISGGENRDIHGIRKTHFMMVVSFYLLPVNTADDPAELIRREGPDGLICPWPTEVAFVKMA